VEGLPEGKQRRTIASLLGFSIIFTVGGAAAGAIGNLFFDFRSVLEKVGGIVVIIFGLHMIGVFRIPFLEYDIRVQQMPDRKWGYLSSALMGIFFSAGWAPCVGPTLSAILTFAANGGSVGTGMLLLSVYSAGLAIPFLFAALGIGWVSGILRKYGKVMHYVEIIMGVLLVVVGVMLFAGVFEWIALKFPNFYINFGL
jgi:cytochrome c-type biogenesis protein